jgi:hypothetical protein
MSQPGGLISLDDCIYDYISESEQSNHKFFKLWNLAFRLMDELGLDFFYSIRSFKLPVNPNKTVELPNGMVQWTKVGVFNANNEITPLRYNENLTTYASLDNDRLSKTKDTTLFNVFKFNSPIWYNFWNGFQYTTLYGMPSGGPFIGTFKIDLDNGLILLSADFAYDYVVLECMMPPKEGEIYAVPVQFREAVVAGLSWLDIRSLPSTRKGNLGDKRERKREFYNQRRLAWARYRPLRLDDAYQWSQMNTRRTVKI